DQRLIVCAGAFERRKGFRDAIWAFDILRYLYDNLRLVLIGDGPDRPRLEQFAHDTQCHKRVHMIGERADSPALLAGAAVVGVPDDSEGGTNVALEAMAAGRPVVAARWPSLTEIIDEQTGFLVPARAPAELARQTRVLLDDAALSQRLGEAGRQKALTRFAVA